MTEDEAKAILSIAFNVSRETLEKINLYIEMLKKEMQNQNLISAASLDHIWARHILDSAQLLHADIFPAEKANGLQSSGTGASWLDMGSGAGFPGIIIAIMSNWNVTLLESRTRRAAFLQSVIDALDLDASVACAKAETYDGDKFSVISARAFAPLPKLLRLASPFSTRKTQYLLPKGRNAENELLEVRKKWSTKMKVIPSMTDSEAGILVGTVKQHD